jgi:hypothetical protein
MSSAFYPGAGCDVFPLITCRSIKNWIYMDSQPRSEFGDNFYEGFERPKFIKQLIQVMAQNEFDLNSIEDNIYTFYNSEHEQTVKYETNSVFPSYVQQRHYDCETIVLCGFDLEEQTINFINKFSHIIVNNISYHSLEEEQLLLTKQVTTIIIDEKWEYWEPKNQLLDNIHKHVVIEHRFITHDEQHDINKE